MPIFMNGICNSVLF